MIEKARKIPLITRIVLTILLSISWILIASNFDMDIQSNWLLSTLVIVAITTIFFPVSKHGESKNK